MSLESFGYIKNLVPTNPLGSDPKSEGDDHLRGLKVTLLQQFSGFTQGKPITITEDQLNAVAHLFRVGAVYLTFDDALDPATLFGGTWVKIQNMMLYGNGSRATGITGGAETHTLAWGEMPSHSHDFEGTNIQGLNVGAGIANVGATHATKATSAAGDGAAHNNMPPFICLNIWRRTA